MGLFSFLFKKTTKKVDSNTERLDKIDQSVEEMFAKLDEVLNHTKIKCPMKDNCPVIIEDKYFT